MQTTTNAPKQKTPQKGKRTPKANKKQKLDKNKSKKINTNSYGRRNKDATYFKKGFPADRPGVRVSFPSWKGIDYNEIQKIFEGCKKAHIENIVIEYDPSVASQRVEELREIKINGNSLKISSHSSKIVSHKRVIRKVNKEEVEAVKKFFNAKSIEKLVTRGGKHSGNYVLTFENEKEAETASKKQFKLDNEIHELAPYFEIPIKKATPIGKKQSETERKLKQQKRKADENDEESDEEEHENGDNTTEDIEMDDDDDDDDDNDDENDDE